LTRRRGATAFVARLQRGTPELNGQIPCSNQVWDLFARLSSSNSRTLTPQTPWNLAIGALTREILLSGSNWECLGTPILCRPVRERAPLGTSQRVLIRSQHQPKNSPRIAGSRNTNQPRPKTMVPSANGRIATRVRGAAFAALGAPARHCDARPLRSVRDRMRHAYHVWSI
jgi:hypothetical protein